MLWYKSFRELRTITLVGMAAMTVACVLIVLNQHTMRTHADAPMTYIAYVWKSVYSSIGRDIFLILSIILGSGGLLQERNHGTAGFTLALPVSRRSIVITRAVIGYCGVLAIAAVPIFAVPLTSRYVGEFYPAAQTAGFFALWAACGAIFYGFTFLLAHRIEGDYIAVLLAIPSLMLYGVLLNLPWFARLRMLDIFDIINGEDMPFFNETQHLLVAPLPWFALAIMLAVSAVFIVLAIRRIQPLDF
ncbi:ABC transporter permease [Edaphobacter albus]|uniref:ABC transporter permease n=1 Tax=Edaphobacter sp. 4G125 TaxID=2763071 RepID=UPI00164760D4|nr:ABC transporter permease [Edaphobacter sp. 4G125]QNI36989.1 ABC transporter permease [Edaphobacter sp. 4G125]